MGSQKLFLVSTSISSSINEENLQVRACSHCKFPNPDDVSSLFVTFLSSFVPPPSNLRSATTTGHKIQPNPKQQNPNRKNLQQTTTPSKPTNTPRQIHPLSEPTTTTTDHKAIKKKKKKKSPTKATTATTKWHISLPPCIELL